MLKSDAPCTFPSIILLINHLLKIWGTTFWPSGQGCWKCVYIGKVTSRGRAEIKSIKTAAKSAIFNFSSVIRGHLENVNTLLTSLVTLSKSCTSDFWKMVYQQSYWDRRSRGVWFLVVLAPCIAGILKKSWLFLKMSKTYMFNPVQCNLNILKLYKMFKKGSSFHYRLL